MRPIALLLSFLLLSDHNCTVDKSLYRCRDRSKCIPLDKVCNKEKDCPDSSDEGELCQETCHPDSCQHGQCISHPNGARCVCGEGFNQVKRGPHDQCEDIDECEDDIICPQSCVNTPGGYHCACWPGFESREGNKSCVPATTGFTSDLYFSTRDAIWKRDLISGREDKLLEVQSDIHAISADDTFLYWGEGGNYPKVSRVRLGNNSSVERMSIRSIGNVEGIAVDWWTGNVYFTDSGRKEIVVLGDASHKSVSLLRGALEKPRGIALHPQSGRMFWTDWGQTPYVGVTQMDGNGLSTLVDSDLKWPNGLSIDYPSERLYWVDSARFKLESIGLDGQQRMAVTLHGTDAIPFSLQVMGSVAYWTDKSKTELFSTDKFTGSDLKTLSVKEGLLSIYTRHSLIQTKPKDGENPCKINPCPYMCLLSREGTRSCVDGNTKAVEHQGTEVESLKWHVLVGYANELYKVSYNYGSAPQVTSYHKISVGNHTISRVVRSPISGDIFVADNENKKIFRIVPQHIQEVTELTIDPIGHVSSMVAHHLVENIYWTDSERRTVEVFSPAKNIQKTMMRLSREHTPMDLEVGADSGRMYLLTKNRTRMTMIELKGEKKSVYPLKTEIQKDQSVQMIVIEAESLVYLSVGKRLISWHMETREEVEIQSNLSPSTMHALFFKGTGELVLLI